MDKEIIRELKNLGLLYSIYDDDWFIKQYEIEPFNIKQVKEYLLKYYLLIHNYYSSVAFPLDDIPLLFNRVDNGIKSDYDIVCENDNIIIYKPKSYINRRNIKYKIGTSQRDNIDSIFTTIYCCLIKSDELKKHTNCDFFVCVINNDVVKFFGNHEIYIDNVLLIKFDIKKYFIADDINDRIKKETDHNIKLLQQKEVNCDLYLYNYDYSNLEVKCKKINGNVILLCDFKTIPRFLKNIEITGEFNCSGNLLENLINCPQNVYTINCEKNILTSLIGAPIYLDGSFHCGGNRLKSLINSPKIIGDTFNCGNNPITTLIGAPYQVKSFGCYSSDLISLIGMSQIVDNIKLGFNKIKNLDGVPNTINRLNIISEKVTSLKICPKIIKGNFYYDERNLMDDYRPLYDSNGNLINEYNG